MAVIQIQRKKGVVYKARIELSDGKRPTKSFKTKKEASRFEAEMLQRRNSNNGDSLILGKIITEEFFHEIFFKSRVSLLSESTKTAYLSHFKNHLMPIIGKKKLSSISALDGDLISTILQQQGHNPKGVNLIMRTARTMLSYAVEREYLYRNPFRVVKQLKESKKNESFWETEEVNFFLKGIEAHYSYPLFVTALNTGMRRGELAALKWKSIDFSRKRIKVVGTRDRYGDKDITKGKYDRTIPMNARLEQLLLTTKPLIASPEDYVFLKPNGVPIDPQHIYRLMNSLSSTVGLTNKIRFHDLRHTFASHFMMNGGSISQLSLILGHTDQRVTQRYTHFAPNYLDSAANIVSF
jgi:integrase